jgi:hypothetical protein
MSVVDRIYKLQPYSREPEFHYVVLLPEPQSFEVVIAAWAYAVRYTAKGLDLPDYDAAFKLMVERHPSWEIIKSQCPGVQIDLSKADQDTPESGG